MFRLQGSKEGKAAWKKRKAALEETHQALQSCSGQLDASGRNEKKLTDLGRALRDRLSDTQINLKPLAARVAGLLFEKVDCATQAKLGKVLFSSLILAAMNDIKKPMREASLESIRSGLKKSELEGGGPNESSLEALVLALVTEVTEKSVRAGGLPEVLLLLLSVTENLPDLDDLTTGRGQPVGQKFATALVECLTSSKSETRSAASAVLEKALEKGVVSVESVKKSTSRLKPAKQRTVSTLLSKLLRNEDQPMPSGASALAAKSTNKQNQRTEIQRKAAAPTSKKQGNDIQQRNHKKPHSPEGEKAEPDSSMDDTHPLASKAGRHATRLTTKLAWPEYPEDSQGLELLSTLKRAWAPHIPPQSLSALFPSTGVRKQDDARKGCELISRAVRAEQSEESGFISAQLDFLLRWLVFVLCSREATAGLQLLLDTIMELFGFLIESRRELSDVEALVIAPFLIEKSCSAKGRFRDSFLEIVDLLKNPLLVPTKRFGSTVCVSIIERSVHAKARLVSYQECIHVVEQEGLVGIGKKGVISTGKMLSVEKTPANKTAAMNLMLAILSRTNGGDIQRLVKICGPNLSNKARQELEQHWAAGGSISNTSSRSTPRQSRLATPLRRQSESPREVDSSKKPNLYDQLPALSLRNRSGNKATTTLPRGISPSQDTANPFSFARPSSTSHPQVPEGLDTTSSFVVQSVEAEEHDAGTAAASLRARLLKIRQKSTKALDDDSGSDLLSLSSASGDNADLEAEYHQILSVFNQLGSLKLPVAEDDEQMSESIESVKKLHAALSKQHNPSLGLSATQLGSLRNVISQHVNDTVANLTR